jgi:hypothetical protein
MTLQTLILVWAALTGAVFSVPSFAQDTEATEKTISPKVVEKKPSVEWSKEEIKRGADVQRHEIPAWFARRAPSVRERQPEPESLIFDLPKVSTYIGRPPRVGPQYACQRSNGTWVFCD